MNPEDNYYPQLDQFNELRRGMAGEELRRQENAAMVLRFQERVSSCAPSRVVVTDMRTGVLQGLVTPGSVRDYKRATYLHADSRLLVGPPYDTHLMDGISWASTIIHVKKPRAASGNSLDDAYIHAFVPHDPSAMDTPITAAQLARAVPAYLFTCEPDGTFNLYSVDTRTNPLANDSIAIVTKTDAPTAEHFLRVELDERFGNAS